MIKYFASFIIIFLSITNVSSQEVELKWKSFSGDFSCSTSHNSKTQPQTFVFISRRVDGRNLVRFHNELWPLAPKKAEKAILNFNDGSQATIITNDSTTNGKTKLRGFTAIIDNKLMNKLLKNKSIDIKYLSNDIVSFPIQGLDTIFSNLIDCTKNLKSYGSKEDEIPVTSPVLLAGFSIKRSDYPKAARKQKLEGKVRFKVFVDSKGKPKDCEITSSSGYIELDNRTCDILIGRSRYKPAKNSNGEPVADYYNSSINW